MNQTDSHEPQKTGPLVGITSTIPVEIVFAAGWIPVDLNNLFITSPQASVWVEEAEARGLPRTLCSWIKGIDSALRARPEIQTVIAVTQGDCSNTQALTELLVDRGIRVIHFNYPYERDPKGLQKNLETLMARLGTHWNRVRRMKKRLDGIRKMLVALDRATWAEDKVHGWENHLFLVNSSDFQGDPDRFEGELQHFLTELRRRPKIPTRVRLGFIGIPPVQSGLYEFVEKLGGRVVFNEIQRQFSMPYLEPDLVRQYLRYTYPYDVFGRISDIQHAVQERGLAGLIHYTQTFCFRQVQDLMIRKYVPVPTLTLEGDKPGPLDSRTRLRLEAFVDLLR